MCDLYEFLCSWNKMKKVELRYEQKKFIYLRNMLQIEQNSLRLQLNCIDFKIKRSKHQATKIVHKGHEQKS